MSGHKRIGDILVELGAVRREVIEEAAVRAQVKGRRIGVYLQQRGFVSDTQVAQALAAQKDLPFARVSGHRIDPVMLKMLPVDVMHRYNFIPLEDDDERLLVAVSDPTAEETLAELGEILEYPLDMVVVPQGDIDHVLAACGGEKTAAADIPTEQNRLGDILVDQKAVSREAVEDAAIISRERGLRIGEVLLRKGLVTDAQLAQALATQKDLPFARVSGHRIDPVMLKLLPSHIMKQYNFIPLEDDDERLLVAVSDPTAEESQRELGELLEYPLDLVVVPQGDIDHVLAVHEEARAETVPAWEAEATPPKKRLGDILVEQGAVSRATIEDAAAKQVLRLNKRLGTLLLEKGVITETHLARAVAQQHELPFARLSGMLVGPDSFDLMSGELIREFGAVPIEKEDERLLVVLHDPADHERLLELEKLVGCPIDTVVSTSTEILYALKNYTALEARLAAEKAAHDERLAAERRAKERLDEEKASFEQLLAAEKEAAQRALDARLAAQMADLEEKAAAEKLVAERAAEELEALEARFASDRAAAEERFARESAALADKLAEATKATDLTSDDRAKLEEKLNEERLGLERRMAEERGALNEQLAQARADAERVAAEQIRAEKVALEARYAAQLASAEEKLKADQRIFEERLAAEHATSEKAFSEKAELEKRLAETKAAAEAAEKEADSARRAIIEERVVAQRVTEQKLEQERAALEHSDAHRHAMEKKVVEQQAEFERKLVEAKAAAQRSEAERLAAERAAIEARFGAKLASMEDKLKADRRMLEERIATEHAEAEKALSEKTKLEQRLSETLAEKDRLVSDRKSIEEKLSQTTSAAASAKAEAGEKTAMWQRLMQQKEEAQGQMRAGAGISAAPPAAGPVPLESPAVEQLSAEKAALEARIKTLEEKARQERLALEGMLVEEKAATEKALQEKAAMERKLADAMAESKRAGSVSAAAAQADAGNARLLEKPVSKQVTAKAGAGSWLGWAAAAAIALAFGIYANTGTVKTETAPAPASVSSTTSSAPSAVPPSGPVSPASKAGPETVPPPAQVQTPHQPEAAAPKTLEAMAAPPSKKKKVYQARSGKKPSAIAGKSRRGYSSAPADTALDGLEARLDSIMRELEGQKVMLANDMAAIEEFVRQMRAGVPIDMEKYHSTVAGYNGNARNYNKLFLAARRTAAEYNRMLKQNREVVGQYQMASASDAGSRNAMKSLDARIVSGEIVLARLEARLDALVKELDDQKTGLASQWAAIEDYMRQTRAGAQVDADNYQRTTDAYNGNVRRYNQLLAEAKRTLAEYDSMLQQNRQLSGQYRAISLRQ